MSGRSWAILSGLLSACAPTPETGQEWCEAMQEAASDCPGHHISDWAADNSSCGTNDSADAKRFYQCVIAAAEDGCDDEAYCECHSATIHPSCGE